MKWIKKNKFTVAAITIFVILSFLTFKVIDIFFPDQGTAIYGDRLVAKVNVENSTYTALEELIKKSDKVDNVKINENGRRINIIITVNNATSISEAKKLTDNVLEPFTESQVGYYDFQVYVKKNDSSEDNFPIIGYKQHNSSGFSWSKDREKTVKEDE